MTDELNQHVLEVPRKELPIYRLKAFWIIAGIFIVSISTFLSIWTWTNINRFSLSTGGDGLVHKIDRKSGDTWILRDGKFMKQHQSRPLPSYEVAEIEGRAGYDRDYTQHRFTTASDQKIPLSAKFSGNLYNGSEWHITRVEVKIGNDKKAGTVGENGKKIEPWSRTFRAELSIGPKSNGTFLIDTIEGHLFEASQWEIREAWGYKLDFDSM